MNKEIDEIIEQIKTAINFKKSPLGIDYHISIYDMEQLLDYITYLQKENEALKKPIVEKWENAQKIKIKNPLQDRINKAIEYIEQFENIKAYYSWVEDGYEEYNYDEDFKKDILNTLRGEDNDNDK